MRTINLVIIAFNTRQYHLICYLIDTQPALTVVLSETTGANTTRYIHGPTGLLAQQNPNGDMRWMLQDGLQSVRGVSDGTSVLSAQAYSPYGEPMFTDLPTEFGFTGEQTDSANEKARYRLYSSVIFR